MPRCDYGAHDRADCRCVVTRCGGCGGWLHRDRAGACPTCAVDLVAAQQAAQRRADSERAAVARWQSSPQLDAPTTPRPGRRAKAGA